MANAYTRAIEALEGHTHQHDTGKTNAFSPSQTALCAIDAKIIVRIHHLEDLLAVPAPRRVL